MTLKNKKVLLQVVKADLDAGRTPLDLIEEAGEVPGAEIIFFVNGGPPGMPPRIFDEFF